MSAGIQALDGVKIVEFGSYAAGPHVGKMLANFGATVVHVESMARPDGFRMQYPPYKDGKPGMNSGGCFTYFNDSKYGVTIDLKSAEGQKLAKRLSEWADIVIENMRPGVIDRLGLGFKELSKTNPGLIMLSTCNMGQTGPRADTPGFGSQLSALAGVCGLTGEKDGPPMLLYGPYIDYIASTLGAAAVLAGLERKQRTGKGAYLDVSQYECGLLFLAGPLLEYHRSGTLTERSGNDDPHAAPHEAFACRGEGWIALSCWSSEEFARLCTAIGRPDLAKDPKLATLEGRKAAASPIRDALCDWARERDAHEAAQLLQSHRVHAHAVNTIADLFADSQLIFRRQWRRRRHPVLGDQAYCYPAFELSETPGDVTAAGPMLGADNERVFRDFLGLGKDEFDALHAKGAMA